MEEAVNTAVNTSAGESADKVDKDKEQYDSEMLFRARAARKKVEEQRRKWAVAKEEEAKAKEIAKEARAKQKAAEKEKQKILSNNNTILMIAKREPESSQHRREWAVKGFFDLLNKLDDGKNGFSKKYNSLHNTEIVYKALMDSLQYNDKSDWVGINGKQLRALIAKEIAKREADIAAAKKILDVDMNTGD